MPKEQKIPLLYQDIVEEISYESLPSEWLSINLSSFSDNISLFDYQQEAVKNAIKLLYYYFNSLQKFQKGENELENIERKKKFFNEIRKFERELLDSLGITTKKTNKLLFNKLKQYYPIIEENSHEKIHFLHFVNRMSFWMATGSGKTIILIKLIEILDKLKQSGLIPNNDILILTHREDLIDQIKQHVDEFNKKATRKIKVWDLKKYDDVKRGNVLAFKEHINIFIYRSDLISEETKEKLLGFEDIENNGRWFVLLDEAHKGDKEDSKRQLYYSLLTRNGFLFNFSATFTDVWDIITTTYNFNLDTFIRKGYGKNVYLSQQELNAFKDKGDFSDKNKQKIVLKSLILLTLSKIAKNNIDSKLQGKHYHNPLLVALVNSVNVEESDLEIFFKELEKIGVGKVDKTLLEEAKKEIIEELSEHQRYVFGSESILFNEDYVKKIKLKDLLKHIFNADSFGKIEVIKIPKNNKELAFKIKTSEKPFCLMRVGDCGNWVKEKLISYEINESYRNESFFKNIDKENDFINILMGSRAFYEGWDSNRPNVMIFINIGKGDAKKYVIQSIGRGVRIRPIKGKRKRLLPLKRENDIVAKELYSKLKQEDISLIETLFVLGTNKKNVEEILKSIKYERKSSGEIIELQENEEIKDKILLIPVYKDRKEVVSVGELPKFEGNRQLLTDFVEWISDERLMYALFSHENYVNPKTLEKSRDFLKKGNFLTFEGNDVYSQLIKLMNHVNITLQDLDKFKQVGDEIVHFKKIRVTLEERELRKLKELINKVKRYKDPSKQESELKKLLEAKKISIDDYTSRIKELSKMSNEEEFIINGSTLRIKHLLNHYYVPIILSEKEKIEYINHIINVESEKKFIEQLENFIKQENNVFKSFDWWMFCKLDEHLDEVYIPYYNSKHNKIEKFKPDFIFWFKKGNKYFIIFIDPKGISYTDYQRKIEGYRAIFEKKDRIKEFKEDNNNISVHLFLKTDDKNLVQGFYKRYWFDDFRNIIEKINN